MATVTSQPARTVREELLVAAAALLDEHGPDALQTRKIAAAAGTSTMAVYTHFGGMPQLIAAITDPWPRPDRAEGIATFVAGPPPATLDDLPEWLATACIVPTEDLEVM